MFQLKHLPHAKHDEEVIFLLRRDWFILVRLLGWYFFLLLVPWLLRLLIDNYQPALGESAFWRGPMGLLTWGYYMFVWLFFYRGWLDYYLDVWIVTNHRILNIELQGLFNRVVAEQKLFRIQDVTAEQKGFLPHFFHYGDVFIQTAAPQPRFVFEQVSEPDKVARQILQLVEWNKKAYPENRG